MGRRLRRLFGLQPRRPAASPMLGGQYTPSIEKIAAAFDGIYHSTIPAFHAPTCSIGHVVPEAVTPASPPLTRSIGDVVPEAVTPAPRPLASSIGDVVPDVI